MRFENAKHFLHIDSYVRVTAIPYGVGRSNGSSKLLPYSGFVRKGYSRTAWREAFERTTDGRPYSGKFRTAVGETCGLPLRKVTSAPYGERCTTGRTHGCRRCIRFAKHVTNAIALVPLQRQGLREAKAFRTVYVSKPHERPAARSLHFERCTYILHRLYRISRR